MLLTRTGSRPTRPAPTRLLAAGAGTTLLAGTAALAVVLAVSTCDGCPGSARAGAPLPPPPTPPSDDAWSAPALVPAPPGAFRSPRHRLAALAAGRGGSLHALFVEDVDGDGRADRLLYAASDGRRWAAPVPIGGDARRIDAPRLALDGTGAVHALWFRSAAGGAAELVERVRGAGGWSAAHALPSGIVETERAAPELAVAVDGAGEIQAVFRRSDGRLARLAGARGRWRAAGSPGAGGPYLSVAAGPGGALAVAQVMEVASPLAPARGAHGNVWASVLRGGAWTAPAGVHFNPAEQAHAPQLAWDGRGVLHAAWLEGAGGDGMPTRLLHATSRDGGLTWSAPDEVDADGSGRIFYSPRLAVDGRGVLHLAFARFRDGVSFPRHYHAAWNGAQWSPVREIVPGEGERQSEIETTVDSRGRVNAVWQGADGRYRQAWLEEAHAPPSR
jgi:hypothetical protein